MNLLSLASTQIPASGGSLTVSLEATAGKAFADDPNECVLAVTGAPAGCILVVTCQQEEDSGSSQPNASITDTQGLTWTKRADAHAASSGIAEIWTAPFSAGGDTTITVDWNKFLSNSAAAYWVSGQEATLSGASQTGDAQAQPSVSITTTRANSVIFVVSSDWNAIAGSRTYRTPSSISPTVAYEWVAEATTHTCGYHYWYQATTAQSYTVGMTAPSGQGAGTAVYEIRTA